MSAPDVLVAALDARPEAERPAFLRELLAYVAAGLVVAEGEALASEAAYRLADAIATRAALPTLNT